MVIHCLYTTTKLLMHGFKNQCYLCNLCIFNLHQLTWTIIAHHHHQLIANALRSISTNMTKLRIINLHTENLKPHTCCTNRYIMPGMPPQPFGMVFSVQSDHRDQGGKRVCATIWYSNRRYYIPRRCRAASQKTHLPHPKSHPKIEV